MKRSDIAKLSIFFLLGCNPIEKTDLQIVYATGKDGLYLYDLKGHSTTKIYSTQNGFLNGSLKFISDSIVSVSQQSRFYPKTNEIKVFEDNTLVNIYSKESYLYKRTEIIQSDKLYIKEIEYNKLGKIVLVKDTTSPYTGQVSSVNEIRFGHIERFYSESEKRDSLYFYSRRGNLYCKDINIDSIFLKWNEDFDPKFGNGYYNPSLSNDKKKIVFQLLPGFLKTGNAIIEMDIATKKITKIQETKYFFEDPYFRPKYSPDDTKLLLGKNSREYKENIWQFDLYVYDLKTTKKKKIGICGDFAWKPKYSR